MDCELMLRAAGGDEKAFEVLVDKYSRNLLNFFLRKNVSYHDAQDLTAKTFLRLWRYRERYRPQAKFTTFLFLAAGQVAVDFFRQAARRSRLEADLASEAEVASDLASAQGLRPMAADDVRRAVASLPEAMRDVVELAVFQDLPYAEVAEILGIPVGTVKSRMFNAMRRLKEILS